MLIPLDTVLSVGPAGSLSRRPAGAVVATIGIPPVDGFDPDGGHGRPDHGVGRRPRSLEGHLPRTRGPWRAPSPCPGSTTWKHSPGPQMSHQKRNSLSEGRVRDTGT